MTITRALIPAAGRGARLDRPGTPKPLVDVGGDPLIVRLLKQLAAAGITHATVVLGYAADPIQRVLTLHPELDVELTFVRHEGWDAGLASSLLAGADSVGDEPFVLAMADHIFDAPLVEAIATARLPRDGVVVLLDTDTDGVFEAEDAVKIRGAEAPTAFGRDLPTFDAVDCGLMLASPALFDALKAAIADGGDCLSDGLNLLARSGRIRGLRTGAHGWDDVDTPAGLVHAEMRLRQQRRARILAGPDVPPPPAATHQFVTGAPVTTDIVVQRGAVRNPLAAGVIPPESASSPVFVITDETVDSLYGEAFVGPLEAAGYTVDKLVMPDGESSKTIQNFGHMAERILAAGIDERSVLISLGGGAVCNVSGLLASTLYRGVGLVHVPTTVMAQCDAAISHKQAVNGAHGKNLIGAYYAPKRIVVDAEVLATLDERAVPDGLAEVLKHALAQDGDFLQRLLDYKGDIRDLGFLESVIEHNIRLKCDVMATDPQEYREGMVLQYGHTVGHPVEHLSGYRLRHGECVGIGMAVAVRVARLMGACDDHTVAQHDRLISAYGLPHRIPDDIRTADIMEGLKYNKRYLTEGTRMALVKGPGTLWSVNDDYAIPVTESVLIQAIDATRADAAVALGA